MTISERYASPPPDMRKDAALLVMLDLRGILGGTIEVRRSRADIRRLADSMSWAFAQHADPVVARAARRLRAQYSFSPIGPRRQWFWLGAPPSSPAGEDSA